MRQLRAHLLGPQGRRGRADRLTADECLGRHRRQRGRVVGVDVRDAIDVRYVGHVVVDDGLVDRDVVDHHRAVDVGHVGRAGRIDRAIRLARREREPRHARRADRDIDAPAYAAAAAAHEGDQGGCVDRPRRHRTGHPAPRRAHIGPAAIVERREAPRRIVDPGPAPRSDPGPVAGAIWRPADRHGTRYPYRAVAVFFAPRAVLVQRFVAGHLAADVARGDRSILTRIARFGPAVERVAVGIVGAAGLRQIGSAEADLLTGGQRRRAIVAVGRAIAAPDRHRGGRAIRCDIEPVFTGLLDLEGQVGCIDFHGLVGRQRAHAYRQRALCQLDLRGAVVQVDQRGAGVLAQAQRGGADVEFGAAALVGPQAVAGGEGAVEGGPGPSVGARGREADRAREVRQARHARGGVGGQRGLRPADQQDRSETRRPQSAGQPMAGETAGTAGSCSHDEPSFLETTRIVRMPLLNAAARGRATCLCKRVFRRDAAWGRAEEGDRETAIGARGRKKTRGPGSAARTGNPFEGSIRKGGVTCAPRVPLVWSPPLGEVMWPWWRTTIGHKHVGCEGIVGDKHHPGRNKVCRIAIECKRCKTVFA